MSIFNNLCIVLTSILQFYRIQWWQQGPCWAINVKKGLTKIKLLILFTVRLLQFFKLFFNFNCNKINFKKYNSYVLGFRSRSEFYHKFWLKFKFHLSQFGNRRNGTLESNDSRRLWQMTTVNQNLVNTLLFLFFLCFVSFCGNLELILRGYCVRMTTYFRSDELLSFLQFCNRRQVTEFCLYNFGRCTWLINDSRA